MIKTENELSRTHWAEPRRRSRASCPWPLRKVSNWTSLALENTRVAEWLRLWFELYAKPNIRSSTAGYYRRAMEEYTIPRMGTTKLNKLTSREIQKLYKDLLENGRTRVAVWVKFFRHLKVRIFYIAKRPENNRFRGVLWS